ncbi:MAG: nucleotidyltransferase family protein [Rhodospirillaceae bacterium]
MSAAGPDPSTQNQSGVAPKMAMVLAAGLGTRMRPITDTLPKPLVPVAGRALIDHILDRLGETGIETAVVNLFHLADQIETHLKDRTAPKLVFVREPERLETGGGVKNALSYFGDAPFFVTNTDALLLNGPRPILPRLAEEWRDDAMDALLLLHSTVEAFGYEGRGDFCAEPDGKLSRRPEMEIAPWLFTGVQILHPRLFADTPDEAFSLNVLYDRAIENDRLYGVVHDGEWFHVGTPDALSVTEDYMSERFAGQRRR